MKQVKAALVVAAVVIAAASLVVSHALTRDLSRQEQQNMKVWAEAMRSLRAADETTDLNLVLAVLGGNSSIPVVVLDGEGGVTTFRNIDIDARTAADSTAFLLRRARAMQAAGRVVTLSLAPPEVERPAPSDVIYVCYDESLMLRRLASYPYVQLGVVGLFIALAIFALLSSKRAEQNKVWVGLSKETAHQLGTPISSLMAWVEILKENYPDDDMIPEMDKDVKRLELIAERFSKIGSLPEPVPASLNEVMAHVMEYMDRRTSSKVKFIKDFPDEDIIIKINASLFEWVIENLCKNAVDAMEGSGTITLHMESAADKAVIEVTDTGKGIRKKDLRNVFKPGFTTKKRGWGLGLSLAKRIVEEYHKGRIFVKSSETGKGTTFRIELKK